MLPRLKGSRFLVAVSAMILLSFLLTRIVLLAMTGHTLVPVASWVRLFSMGLWFDAATVAYCLIPFLLLRAICPNRWAQSLVAKLSRMISLWFVTFLLIFIGVAEILFWQEFSTRFNFIAVDYLLYTQEMIGNIRQSYPMGLITTGMLVGSAAISIAVYAIFLRKASGEAISLKRRAAFLALATALPSLSYAVVRVEQMEGSGNAYVDELSGNGLFSFSAAFRRNELDYDKFYRLISEDRAMALMKELKVPRFAHSGSLASEARLKALGFSRRPKNVILVSVESLSASYVGSYGAHWGITPELDRLADSSLKFDRFFATGTRTVKGLEALSLGLPPLPGQSIVRRPNNEHLATVGQILAQNDITPYFIYGGYGYFDNMNAYFSANDYKIVDRTDFPKESIAGENVWGVADESLFSNAVRVFDEATAKGQRFFGHIMTTSNHRPFTFPEGRIKPRWNNNRYSAIQYTDYAIGRFVEEAKSHAWFNDTLFIITADHCASVAGKTKLPIEHYHIPLLFYAPALVKPGVDSEVGSQIDLSPTILDLMGVGGEDQFFGRSYLNPDRKDARAFLSNYQQIGYYKNDLLTVLAPKQKATAYRIDAKTLEAVPAEIDQKQLEEAIAYYQLASRAFKTGALKVRPKTKQ